MTDTERLAEAIGDHRWLCPQCGLRDATDSGLDEDGCCSSCGADCCPWERLQFNLRYYGWHLVSEADRERLAEATELAPEPSALVSREAFEGARELWHEWRNTALSGYERLRDAHNREVGVLWAQNADLEVRAESAEAKLAAVTEVICSHKFTFGQKVARARSLLRPTPEPAQPSEPACTHEGIGLPGCTTCDPATGTRPGASRCEPTLVERIEAELSALIEHVRTDYIAIVNTDDDSMTDHLDPEQIEDDLVRIRDLIRTAKGGGK